MVTVMQQFGLLPLYRIFGRKAVDVPDVMVRTDKHAVIGVG
jgi:hypothetical protein